MENIGNKYFKKIQHKRIIRNIIILILIIIKYVKHYTDGLEVNVTVMVY